MKKAGKGGSGIGAFTATGDHADFIRQVEEACDQAEKNLVQDVSELGARYSDKAQGNFAESWHAETFNVDATLNRMEDVKATVLKSNKLNSPDIQIKDSGEIVSNYSSKYYGTAEENVREQRGYAPQELLIPKEQLEDGKKYLEGQLDPRVGVIDERFREMDGRLTDRVKYGDAESEPLTRADSEKKLEEIRREQEVEIQPNIDASVMVQESLRSGAIAAGITFGMTVAPRIYDTLVQYAKGVPGLRGPRSRVR